jgi:hypothetical protein
MVIVLPNEDIFKRRKAAVFACATACDSRDVSWVSICCHDVTEENLTFLYNKSSVRYIYWCGHANDNVKGVYRTHTECWRKGAWWDIFSKKWHKIKVFSYTRQAVPDAEPLPDGWDDLGFDLWKLGMKNSGDKKIVFIDSCLSAAFRDMAFAYGMFSDWNAGTHDQVYIGWKIEYRVGPGWTELFLVTTKGVRMFWERMGQGDSVYDALYYTSVYGEAGVPEALWGLNAMLDIGQGKPDEIDDNIIVWGEGLTNRLTNP